MATEPILAALDLAAVRRRHGLARSGVLSGYWSLTKPEVNFLIAVTVAAGLSSFPVSPQSADGGKL